jgi:hypothetical protein
MLRVAVLETEAILIHNIYYHLNENQIMIYVIAYVMI